MQIPDTYMALISLSRDSLRTAPVLGRVGYPVALFISLSQRQACSSATRSAARPESLSQKESCIDFHFKKKYFTLTTTTGVFDSNA